MKNTIKLKTISIAIILLGASGSASAQWAVVDAGNIVQSTITAAQSTITAAQSTMTQLNTYMGNKVNAGNGQQVDKVNESINLFQKQSVINEQIADMHNRKAMGDAEIGRTAMHMLPTLAACREASSSAPNSPKSVATTAASRATGGGKNGAPTRTKAVVSTATAMAAVLQTKRELGTCTENLKGIAGCTSVGVYAGADTNANSLQGNIRGIDSTKEDQAEFNNLTYDATGWEVAKKYISDATFYDKAKVASNAQLKKNPAYEAMYESVMTKLNASNKVLTDIAKLRRGSSMALNSIAGKDWAKITDPTYKQFTGIDKKPTNPSMMDLLNFDVRKSYLGSDDIKLQTTEELNKRLGVANYIALQQYIQQENTNLLLSHILVQLTTPVNKAAVDAEHARTMNAR